MNRAILSHVRDILAAGRMWINGNSSEDLVSAAAFVLDNGLLYCREQALEMVDEELAKMPPRATNPTQPDTHDEVVR